MPTDLKTIDQDLDIDALVLEFETHARIGSDRQSSMVVRTAIINTQSIINRKISQSDLDNNSSLKKAIIDIAIYYFNSRDFQSQQNLQSLESHTRFILAPFIDLAENLEE